MLTRRITVWAKPTSEVSHEVCSYMSLHSSSDTRSIPRD